jgi:hypothetical protein
MYHGITFSGCEESEILESLRITTTGVLCASESQVGEVEVLAMAVPSQVRL